MSVGVPRIGGGPDIRRSPRVSPWVPTREQGVIRGRGVSGGSRRHFAITRGGVRHVLLGGVSRKSLPRAPPSTPRSRGQRVWQRRVDPSAVLRRSPNSPALTAPISLSIAPHPIRNRVTGGGSGVRISRDRGGGAHRILW